MTAQPKTSEFLRTERQRTAPPRGLVTIAALWPKMGDNLGTLLRTLDAIRGELVVPRDANAAHAVRKGNTIGDVHIRVTYITEDPIVWLAGLGWRNRQVIRVVGVELAHNAITLAELRPATVATFLVLGHETTGIPAEAFPYLDEVVEIPMFGVGNSLNVAVAGSLVAYKLAGLV